MFIKINFEALSSASVIITFIIAVFFSIFFIWVDYREKRDEAKSEEERRKKKWFYRQRLFFTFLLGGFSIYQAYSNKVDEIQNSHRQLEQNLIINAKQDSIAVITRKLDSTSNKLNEKNDALIASGKNIIKAQGRSLMLQDSLLNQMTGGNSVAFLQLQIKAPIEAISNKPEVLQLHLLDLGEYPINNVSVSYYTSENRKPVKKDSRHHEPQRPVVRIVSGDPQNSVFIQNIHLYSFEDKIVKSIDLDFDTSNLVDVKWTVKVSWRNVKYTVKFRTIPPSQKQEHWAIEDLSISSNGRDIKEDELIPFVHKRLKTRDKFFIQQSSYY